MREILFRGKRIDNGKWVTSGNLIRFNPECGEDPVFIPGLNEKCTCTHDEFDNIIAFNDVTFYKVNPKTVGQFTGLPDKNGTKIFEGDIILYTIPDGSYAYGIVKFRETDEVGFCVEWFNRHDTGWLRQDIGFWAKYREIKVIGNIHDNPELLEVHDID